MPKKARRPAIAEMMKNLVANRGRGYRIMHVQMTEIIVALGDEFTREEIAAELGLPVSLVVGLMQREGLSGRAERIMRAFDEVMEMPLAPWVYAGGDALFEGALMVPAVEVAGVEGR